MSDGLFDKEPQPPPPPQWGRTVAIGVGSVALALTGFALAAYFASVRHRQAAPAAPAAPAAATSASH